MNEIPIQVVLVLYRVDLSSSRTYCSLPHLPNMRLLVCDNTPGEHYAVPDGFQGKYVRQPDNPGLAQSYNLGFAEAQKNGCPWLLLLDQDTQLTPEYLAELQAAAEHWHAVPDVVAIVPKLMERGLVESPHPPIRLKRAQPIAPSFTGFAPPDWSYYNSGALVRVERIQCMGGFPKEFWLDFLDHATFHLLRRDGGRIWVLEAALQHSLSTNEAPRRDAAYLGRKANVREAENLYYRKYGSRQEVRFYRWRTLKDIAVSLKHLDAGTAAHQWQMFMRSFRKVTAEADTHQRATQVVPASDTDAAGMESVGTGKR